MNRYSLIFAAMVAVSFVSPPTRNSSSPDGSPSIGKAVDAHGGDKPEGNNSSFDLDAQIRNRLAEFLSRSADPTHLHPVVLFATVPHPIETHLAADFDENVAALQNGIQDSGFLFDSAWIPWESSPPYDRLRDSLMQRKVVEYRDGFPGVLFFRRNSMHAPEEDPYGNGLIVFLIAEKPTAGLELQQADKAIDILKTLEQQGVPVKGLIRNGAPIRNATPIRNGAPIRIHIEDPIRIAGPTYTGSLPSFGVLIAHLHERYNTLGFLVRSGIVGGDAALRTLTQVTRSWPPGSPTIDFGTSGWCYEEWTGYAEEQLEKMGMNPPEIAFLAEDESGYGIIGEQGSNATQAAKDSGVPGQLPSEQRVCPPRDPSPTWQVPFPRDISSLRTSYEKQGIFQNGVSIQPWKRGLDLKNDDAGEGDTVPSFGKEGTVAQQESILLGISTFIKTHHIRAVIISATNVQDLYFLSQFLHVNNNGLRIVLVGSTRLFLRGNTAPFRGDLVVDSFPMLPRLPEWTTGALGTAGSVSAEHIFSTGFAEGIYFSTIDLLADRQTSVRWLPEYSEPQFAARHDSQSGGRSAAQTVSAATAPEFRPPMYLSAFGVNSVWPAGMDMHPSRVAYPDASTASSHNNSDSSAWQLEMPFVLYAHSNKHASRSSGTELPGCNLWKTLCGILFLVGLGYSGCFLYARPVLRSFCASFEPVGNWRYWFFTVTLPALILGAAFFVLAWPLWPLSHVSTSIRHALWFAVTSSIVLPLLISLAALAKAKRRPDPEPEREDTNADTDEDSPEMPPVKAKAPDPFWTTSKLISLLPPLILLVAASMQQIRSLAQPDTSALLNAYRKMHWESGLSLLPSFGLVLLALFIWCRLASQSAALMNATPRIPDFSKDKRISSKQGKWLAKVSSPVPKWSDARWLWIEWIIALLIIISMIIFLPAFREVTTLESHWITLLLLTLMTLAAGLILFDLLQFLSIWKCLSGVLHTLDTCFFKRSFVVIDEFQWPGLWSFAGISYTDRRAVLSSLLDCLNDLVHQSFLEVIKDEHARSRFESNVQLQQAMRVRYRTTPLREISTWEYRRDLRLVFHLQQQIGTAIAYQLEQEDYPEPQKCDPCSESIRRALESKSEEKNPHFRKEAEEVYRLRDWQRYAERYICLLYIAFLQIFIARLHCLMISVGGMFSAIAIAIAIYPFTPMKPFFLGGFVFLALIAWSFFHVFSQMDTDPILSRIVNGDDRKLQWSFYGKYAESLALPVLTLVSSLLPGGAGRFLDIAQQLLEHGQ